MYPSTQFVRSRMSPVGLLLLLFVPPRSALSSLGGIYINTCDSDCRPQKNIHHTVGLAPHFHRRWTSKALWGIKPSRSLSGIANPSRGRQEDGREAFADFQWLPICAGKKNPGNDHPPSSTPTTPPRLPCNNRLRHPRLPSLQWRTNRMSFTRMMITIMMIAMNARIR